MNGSHDPVPRVTRYLESLRSQNLEVMKEATAVAVRYYELCFREL